MQFEQCGHNDSKYWKLVDNLTVPETSVKVDRVFYPNSNNLCEETETQDLINRFFSKVGEKVVEHIEKLDYIHTIKLYG